MDSLQFTRILQSLAAQCQSDLGQATALQLRPAPDVAQAQARLARIDQAQLLLQAQVSVQMPLRLTIASWLEAAQRGATLEGTELAVLAKIARATVALLRQAKSWPFAAEDLRRDALELPDCSTLSDLLADSIDEDGLLLDTASPALQRLRAEVLNLAARLRKRIAELVKETDEQGLLQDDYYTLRDDRYVLPIKSSDKRALGGIIHGSSQTGQTVYVEPREMVEGNNQLALACDAVRREEQRILLELSGFCADSQPELQRAVAGLVGLDLCLAGARLATTLAAHRPQFTKDRLRLRKARHPILVLEGAQVVASDLILEPGQRWLVISGANGGGKTVALTTLGLAAIMARHGLPVCAAIDSEIPWFCDVHVVVGDAQNLSAGLSTFEGHLRAVKAALEAAQGNQEEVLVLLDELASGTEPIAASALATSILEQVGAWPHVWGAVTTHFEACKLIALRNSAFINAALELQPQTMAPTYRLRLGEIGASNPLALAARIGLDPAIVTRAEQLVGGGGSQINEMLDNLQRERALLQAQLAQVEQQQLQLDRARALLEDQRRHEQMAADRRIERAASTVMAELTAIQRDLSDAKKALRSGDRGQIDGSLQTLRQQTLALADLQARVQSGQATAQRPAVEPAQLRVNQSVWHQGLGRLLTVTEIDNRAKRVRLRAGLLETWAAWDDVRAPLPMDGPGTGTANKSPTSQANSGMKAKVETDNPRRILPVAADPEHQDTYSLRTPERTCDLRGQRVEESLQAVDQMLDRAVMTNAPGICVVHGLGTGAVRDAVRRHLQHHPQVDHFRAGIRGEGGDGATLVWVRQ